MDTPQSSERREIEGCTQVSSFQTLKRRFAVWLTGNSAVYSPQNSDNGEFCGLYTAELRQRKREGSCQVTDLPRVTPKADLGEQEIRGVLTAEYVLCAARCVSPVAIGGTYVDERQ